MRNLNKQEIIKVIEKIEQVRCPKNTEGQSGCYIDCHYYNNLCEGGSCLFSDFIEALKYDDNFKI